MTTFLHPMSSCMGGSPGSSRPSGNLALQPRHLANDAHQEANLQKQTKQAEFYSKGASCDKPVLNSFEPVFVWTLGSIYGNKAGFSTAKTLTENQEHILLKWMASWTKEQESTCDQRVLARGHQCLLFPKPPLKQYLVKSHSSNNRLQHWLKWIATLWHLQFQCHPYLGRTDLRSPSKLRPEEEVIVAQGGSMSLQPTRQITKSWGQTPVLAKFKDWKHSFWSDTKFCSVPLK